MKGTKKDREWEEKVVDVLKSVGIVSSTTLVVPSSHKYDIYIKEQFYT